ncbi:hypothetical protein [Mycolicibacterium conceptionense]|uniref:hypothetical protein n=1 Tax=Mycolicibacterium conceptionense TaxID=451644 RepID=UPI00096FF3F7|nr:hypothetical protein [Mycolicibacterium conceptionense]OMB79233.1 hypothetical protein A5743_14100 [Mycolicibacterium conceptionense]
MTEPIRSAESREVFIYLEGREGVPAEIWTNPGDYGDSRRKRLKPRCISVTWRRRNAEPWQVSWLNVHANYMHANASNTGMSVCFIAGPGGELRRPVEDWMRDLLAEFTPEGEVVPV